MNTSIWNKRIPTLLGIIVILFGIVVTSYIIRGQGIFTSNATAGDTPQKIRISNVTDTSFTVSYSTSESVAGFISYGKDKNLGQSAFDDKTNKSTPSSDYKTHYFTVKNLKSNTTYYFSLMSAGTTYLDNGQPFSVQTGQKLTNNTHTKIVKGSVMTTNGTTPAEGIVYITSEKANTLTSMLGPDGTYTIELKNLRSSDATAYLPVTGQTPLSILIVVDTDFTSDTQATLITNQSNPVPLMILGKKYDFTIQKDPLQESAASQSASLLFPALLATSSATTTPQILSPKKAESFTDQKPLFKGTALPNETVQVIIHSDENIDTSVTADKNGNWTYRPPQSLSPGQHIITIITRNKAGILQTVTQSFTVHAQGSKVNQTATPSATLTPKITMTPPITPTPTLVVPTATPTTIPTPTTIFIATVSNTPTPTITQTGIDTPTPTIIQTKGGKDLPASGNSLFTIVAAASTIAIIIGAFLLFPL